MMLDLLSRVFQAAVTPVLWLSLTAAFVAVIVMILRRILRSRIPHQALCVLWLIVFARLLLPVSIETPFSLVPPNITNQIYQTEQEAEQPAKPGGESELPVASPGSLNLAMPDDTQTAPGSVISDPVTSRPQSPVTRSPVISQPEAPTVSDPVVLEPQATVPPIAEDEPPVLEEPVLSEKELRTRNGQAIAASVWLLGVAAMLVSGIVSYAKLRRQVYDAIRAEDGVWEHPSLRSPFILGLFRPKIYLPMGILGPARQFILHHERAHLRRWDHVVKPICWLALAIHWFNPFAWGAFLLMSRDIEAACDESVIRKLGSEVKADYSATLLALATNKRFPAPSPLSFGEEDAEERIKNVLKFKKPVLWVSIGAVVVAVIAAVCLLTNQSPRSLDSYYPRVDWEKTESVTASFQLSDYSLDYDVLALSDDAAAEACAILQEYKYWRDVSHLIPDDRRDWYYHWRLIYSFEDQTSIELTLCITDQLSITYYDGVKFEEIHYTVNKETLKEEIQKLIDREVDRTYTAGFHAAMNGVDAYSKELPALLAALIPVNVEFSAEDPLTADDCAAIFDQAMWLSEPYDLLDEPYNTDNEHRVSLRYVDMLLSKFLVGYDRINWEDYSDRYISHSERIYISKALADQRDFLESAVLEQSVPYSEPDAQQLMESLGLSYHGEEIYDVTVSFTYTGNEAVKRTYCVLFGEDMFRVLGASPSDGSATASLPVFPGYTTDSDYPRLYFKTEYNSLGGRLITAYKLVDGELVLVGGYDEHLANNFSGLIGPDGVEEHILASPDELYAMFEELLNEACGKTMPSGPDLSEYTTDPDYPGLYFKKETNFQDGEKVTAYELVSNQLILVARYQEYPEYGYCGIAGPDGREQHVYVGNAKAYDIFEEYLKEAVKTPTIILEEGKNVPVPDFLTEEQQILYRQAYQLYHDMFGGDTGRIDSKWDDGSFTYGTVAVNGVDYTLASGLYQNWNDFDDAIHFVFTDRFWNEKNGSGGLFDTYIDYGGRMAYIQANKGSVLEYNSNFPDRFELIFQSDEEIRFNVIGHFNEMNSTDRESYDYTVSAPVCLVRTETGWRVDEFHLAEEAIDLYPKMYPFTLPDSAVLLGSLPEYELYLYQPKGSIRPVIYYQGREMQLTDVVMDESLRPLEFYPGDRDQDGITEIMIWFNQGHGTGFYEDGLLVCRLSEGELVVDIHDWSALAERFNAANSFSYDSQTHKLAVTYMGMTAQAKVPEYLYGLNWDSYGTAAVVNGDQVQYKVTGSDRATLTFMPALSNGDPVATYVGIELQCMLRYTGSEWAVEKELHLKDATLAGMPMDLVTPATIPSNPEEYYLVAEIPEQNIRLYARNSGSEVLLVKDGLWKTYERRTHIEELVLPQVWYKSGSQWETDALFTISQIRNDGTHYVEELACYQFYVGDWSKWTDDAHDWCFKAEDFNRNNTVVYDAETNTFAMTYKGRTYYTQPVGDFPASVNLPDGFTGVALITGHHVDYELKYTEYGRPSVSVTVKAALGFTSEGDFDENRIWQSPDGYYEQSAGQIGLTIVFYPDIQMGGFYYSDVHLKAGYEFPGLATTDGSETLWQDVVQNRIDAGFGDFYLIREDGTLVKWGSPDGALEGSHIGDNHAVDDPLVLMEHVVYVDANGEGSVYALDENGTL